MKHNLRCDLPHMRYTSGRVCFVEVRQRSELLETGMEVKRDVVQ